jgi:hypothetical protein
MKHYLTVFAAAAACALWAALNGHTAAMASSGFTGTWCNQVGNAYRITDFPSIYEATGGLATWAHYSSNGTQLVADRWNNTATLSSNGDKLHWRGGEVWYRTSFTSNCARYARSSAAAAASTPMYRNLNFVTVALAHPVAPLAYWDVWTAMSTRERVGYTCLSFKNTSNVTATRVLIALSLLDKDGQVIDRGHIDRKGTFSPNVAIEGWGSIAAWSSSGAGLYVGHHGYKDNCISWRPDDQTQAQAYPHVQSYNLHAQRIEYADGTVWPRPSESAAPSPSPSKRVRER